MDIDLLEEEQLQSTSRIPDGPSEPTFVFVDDAHPFDLDVYIANYKGRTAIDRLTHIMHTCPQIAPLAAAHAARLIPTTRDTNLYGAVQAAYESARAKGSAGELPPASEVLRVDQAWSDATSSRNISERQRLEVELKNYTGNMIKESIRMAHRDLGNFYRAAGDYTTAMRHHTKSREFCTTSQHVLDMNFACLELLIEQGHYAHIGTYVYKAESALDALAVSLSKEKDKDAAAALTAPAGSAAASKKAPGAAERERVQSKLDYASGLSRLGQGHYERAAQAFLKVGSVESLGEWVDTLLAPGDIAIYGTLCALASYSRGAVGARVLDNSDFGVFVEQEPYVRELLDAYMGSRFKEVLGLLDRFSTRHYLDIHLSSHVKNLTNLIRDKCLVMYLQPFASIRLELMSAAFGWTVEDTERAVVGLIQSGEIKARVDSLSKVLRARDVDPRTELFLRATAAGEEMQGQTRRLLLRLRLQQAELVVKAPKGYQAGLARDAMDYMMD